MAEINITDDIGRIISLTMVDRLLERSSAWLEKCTLITSKLHFSERFLDCTRSQYFAQQLKF